MAEGLPVVFSDQKFADLLDAKMAGQKIVVMRAN